MTRSGWHLLGRARTAEEAITMQRGAGRALVRLMPKQRGGFTVFAWVEAN